MANGQDLIEGDIRQKKYRPVYLIFGEESWLVAEYTRRLKQAIVGDDALNFTEFSRDVPTPDQAADLLQTAPLFADHRLVLVRGSGLFTKSAPGWPEVCTGIPAGSHLIFSESQVDKRSQLYKAVGRAGCCAEMTRQSESEIRRFIRQRLEHQGYEIEPAAVSELYQRTGDDMTLICSEIDKLCAYCAETRHISVRDIAAVGVVRVENQIFAMIQKASEGKRKEAMDLYRDLLALQEKPSVILYHTGRTVSQLYAVKRILAEGGREDSVARALGLKSPYIAQKLIRQSRSFPQDRLERYMQLAVDLEQRFKSGVLDDQIAAEMLLAAIACGE